MKFNPGETAPKTGTYNVVDSNGKVMNTAEIRAANGTTKSTEFDEKKTVRRLFSLFRVYCCIFFRLKL